jgi:hypothetical protein
VQPRPDRTERRVKTGNPAGADRPGRHLIHADNFAKPAKLFAVRFLARAE